MASEVETVVNNEILIQNYRVIYDKTCREYRAWKEVADKLGIEVDEAVRRYNSIRTNFSKYLKRQKKGKVSGTGKKDIPKIKEEYEYLRWLTVHIKHRNTTTNYVRRRLLTERVSLKEYLIQKLMTICVMPMIKLTMMNTIVLMMKPIQ